MRADGTMTTQTALGELERALRTAGVDADRPGLAEIWPVWLDWLARPVEDMAPEESADMALFEASLNLSDPDPYMYDPPQPGFTLSFVRQFTHEDEDGEYDHMEQLGLELKYPPLPAFVALATPSASGFASLAVIWGEGSASLAAWPEKVSASSAFRTALDQRPGRFRLWQSDL